MTGLSDLDARESPERTPVRIRPTALRGADATAVSRLVRTYLLQTESEKREHGIEASASPRALPARYRREVDNPALAYGDCAVMIAEVGDRPVGVAVVRMGEGESEIKRLWTDPSVRGRGVGRALLDAALDTAAHRVRLSVWHWRAAAIGLYRSRGFVAVASWDDRDGVICMARPADTLPLR